MVRQTHREWNKKRSSDNIGLYGRSTAYMNKLYTIVSERACVSETFVLKI